MNDKLNQQFSPQEKLRFELYKLQEQCKALEQKLLGPKMDQLKQKVDVNQTKNEFLKRQTTRNSEIKIKSKGIFSKISSAIKETIHTLTIKPIKIALNQIKKHPFLTLGLAFSYFGSGSMFGATVASGAFKTIQKIYGKTKNTMKIINEFEDK